MCGRYHLSAEESREIAQIISKVQDSVKTGEIFPTNRVPVILDTGHALEVQAVQWGYPRFQGKSGSIINARSETALERPMFRKSVRERRCAIPTTGFYEWGTAEGGRKQKYLFRLPGQAELYLAGLWNDFAGEQRCVILTTGANDSMREIHNRMPLVLHKSKMEAWIADPGRAVTMLRETPPQLERTPVS